MSGFKYSNNMSQVELEADSTLTLKGTLDTSTGTFKLGGTTVSSSAAELNIMDGVTATAAEINSAADGIGTAITFAVAAGGTNVCEVTVTVKDGAGGTVAAVHHFDIYLSDAATGAGLTGTTASGTVTAKAASGVVIDTQSAKKALHVQTLPTGVFILEITDSAKTGFYVCAIVPATGKVAVSDQLVTGNYG